MFFAAKKPAVVAVVVVPFDRGSLLTMSLMYAAEFGLIRLAGMLVTGREPAGQTPLTVRQTGWIILPATIPVVGMVGLNVA